MSSFSLPDAESPFLALSKIPRFGIRTLARAYPKEFYALWETIVTIEREERSKLRELLEQACSVCHEVGGNPYCTGCGKKEGS